MNFDLKLESSGKLLNLELMAQQIVEGFNSGYHKSPFHGFSSEFEEHKIYNFGESTKHIDWNIFQSIKTFINFNPVKNRKVKNHSNHTTLL